MPGMPGVPPPQIDPLGQAPHVPIAVLQQPLGHRWPASHVGQHAVPLWQPLLLTEPSGMMVRQKIALYRLVLLAKVASVKSASTRQAPLRLARVKLTPVRSAPPRLARERLQRVQSSGSGAV